MAGRKPAPMASGATADNECGFRRLNWLKRWEKTVHTTLLLPNAGEGRPQCMWTL